MRVVLYADDLDPITVIDLPPFAEKYLRERGWVKLAVMMPPMLSVLAALLPPPSACADLRIVTVYAEQFIRKGHTHLMLFTRDEESAMLLKCAFLPGQQGGLWEREQAAFAKGFLEALARVGRIG